ncbi:WHG domain-containing protein [Modestobacter sp. VKM Ac-2979]|uniref:TetR/AcrR family transcriptional regulator n=1 Tax=unclassified Modestobacter TaxID=2643866 RepID=UPI0022AB6363|nr:MULTISPECIES: TetR/AcrR family transcriptional regulator [unclassified Modestobacter]MCZ2813775.1 WHG domain-containing protein [Modestobacter sp. VKM Ac-2979]MCZ2844250.1 WHG domain-containing protein [Modestobacter sp. VKM Ac-2980]
MPRAGLDRAAVVAAGAALADEVGFTGLTMGGLAERLGVRTPSLYKHVNSQEDLNRQIAALALAEAAEAVGAATQGRSGRDALAAAAHAFRDFGLTHPGRYAATIGVEPTGPDDPIAVAGLGLLDSFTAVLRSYAVEGAELDHALRALRSFLHGFATLQSANGFQWSADIDESFEWLIDLLDRGLRSVSSRQ